MSKILDRGNESAIAEAVVEVLDEAGYTPEEILAGLTAAVLILAERTADPEAALDEVACLIADFGGESE